MEQTNPPPSRRTWTRLRVSIRAMMVAVLVLGGEMAWVVHWVTARRAAVTAVQDAGGHIRFDYDYRLVIPDSRKKRSVASPYPAWLRRAVGDEVLHDVTFAAVDFSEPEARDPEAVLAAIERFGRLETLIVKLPRRVPGLGHLERLRGLRQLQLTGPGADDEALAHVARLTSLQSLQLDGPNLTDAGLAHLARLTHVEELGVIAPDFTDAGLAHLGRLTALRSLHVRSRKVTGTGLDRLAPDRLEDIGIASPAVSDEGLAHLGRQTKLKVISLQGARQIRILGQRPRY